jgi:site-specific recombinase XerD
MIEKYFASRRFVERVRSGPLTGVIDQIAKSLTEEGYCADYIRGVLSCAHHFGVFAEKGGRRAPDFDDALLGSFVVDGGVAWTQHSYVLQLMRKHLITLGLFNSTEVASDPFFGVLVGYDRYLHDVHGVAVKTRQSRIAIARDLLAWYRRTHPDLQLGEMSRADVLTSCQELLKRPVALGTKSLISLGVRSFLRYLRFAGVVQADLSDVVPTVMHYKLASVPKHLPWAIVRKLVQSVDTSRPPGKRDKAILLLIAGLALRNGSIQGMQLNHISWRLAEIRIPRTKGGKGLVLPLSQEVGDALSDYILHERPQSESRFVFLHYQQPHGALNSKSAITSMIYKRLRQAGIEAPVGAGRLLRHSLATQLVNSDVPIKQIADTFGHSSINTTAIYTKVHYTALARVALPFPVAEVMP